MKTYFIWLVFVLGAPAHAAAPLEKALSLVDRILASPTQLKVSYEALIRLPPAGPEFIRGVLERILANPAKWARRYDRRTQLIDLLRDDYQDRAAWPELADEALRADLSRLIDALLPLASVDARTSLLELKSHLGLFHHDEFRALAQIYFDRDPLARIVAPEIARLFRGAAADDKIWFAEVVFDAHSPRLLGYALIYEEGLLTFRTEEDAARVLELLVRKELGLGLTVGTLKLPVVRAFLASAADELKRRFADREPPVREAVAKILSRSVVHGRKLTPIQMELKRELINGLFGTDCVKHLGGGPAGLDSDQPR